MKKAGFVHLHVHSQYSLLDGACRFSDLIDSAQSMGMPAVSLTDHGNIFGAIEFYQLARKKGIKPLIGCETYVAVNSRHDRGDSGQKSNFHHLTLLVKNEQGYHNLLRLISIAYGEGFYYKPRIDREVLAAYCAGLVGLSGCLKGQISSLLLQGEVDAAYQHAGSLRDLFEPESFYLEIMDHGLPEQKKINPMLLKLGKDLDIPLVATNDVHYLKRDMARAHEVMLCLQTQTTLDDPNHMRMSTNEFYFKSPQEMAQLFPDNPETLENTLRVMEICNLEITFDKLHLPKFEVPDGLSDIAYVRRLYEQNLSRLYDPVSDDIRSRLDVELGVIEKLGFASYFLIVSDFVNYAKSQGIPVGPGRGSAAGSIVSYLLGITSIDPLKYDLLFERFLNPERVTMPDIDIDFCYERRDEVIDYVTQKYGRDNVAQIITFGTMAAKGVIRDVARAMSVPYAEADKIAKMVPDDLNIRLSEALESSPDLKQAYEESETVKDLIDTAKVLEGLARHSSTHAAGVVISDDPLYELIPLYKSNDGQITTGYSMSSLEKIGLLKMDFLGLKTLTVIAEAVKIIKRTRDIDLHVDTVPLTDGPTYELFCKAQTLGVFQLESGGMRDILRKLLPDKFEDIIALLALYRPGPLGSGMVDDFIQRKRTGTGVVYDHPLLESVLRDTYGIILYQEQVMRITNVLAGFSLAQADLMRRAMGKKKQEIIEGLKKDFISGAAANKVDKKIAEKVFGLIEYFAGYGFNKSHSAAYALISFQTAYLKANYPIEFMAALLTSERENTDKIVQYIAECKRMDIQVLPPDVNESLSQFTVVNLKQIRFGLAAVKNVGAAAVEEIIRERRMNGPFTTLLDMCERLGGKTANRKTLESLIKCGACDGFGTARSRMTAELEGTMAQASALQKDRQNGQMMLFDLKTTAVASPAAEVAEWSLSETLAYEKALLGFYITGHPLEEFRDVLRRFSIPTVSAVMEISGEREVTVAGVIEKVKTTFTKRGGEKMAIVRIGDGRQSVDALVFPQTYQTYGAHCQEESVTIFRGRLDCKEETPKIIVSAIYLMNEAETLLAGTLRLQVDPGDVERNVFTELKQVFSKHPGTTDVHLVMNAGDGKKVRIRAGTGVMLSPVLMSALEQLLGVDDVGVSLKPPPEEPSSRKKFRFQKRASQSD